MSSQTYMSMTKPAKSATQGMRECSPSPEEFHQGKYDRSKITKAPCSFRVPSKDTYFIDRCDNPMEEICISTNYFKQIPDEFKYAMFKFICDQSHKSPSVYGQYEAPPEREIVESINGRGGYFLKKTAEEANIYLIWFDRQKNIYKFWGASKHEVRDAMNRIRSRIVKYVIHVPTPTMLTVKVEHVKVEHVKVDHAKVDHSKVRHREPIQLSKENLATTPPPPSPKASVYFKPIVCETITALKHWPTKENIVNPLKDEDVCPPRIMRSISVAPCGFASDNDPPQPFGLCRSISIAF
jgi:hypothetical protein